MTELLVAVGFAIGISAMCSLFEAVLYSVPESHVEAQVEAGSSSAQTLKKLRADIDRPITAILSLNTIANTAGASVAGALATSALGSRWLGLFSACFTLAILTLSEVIPKTAGVVYSRQLSLRIARPLLWMVKIFAPLIWLCRFATRLVTRQRQDTAAVSEEEILSMARLGMRSGSIEADEAEVIENILTLPSKTARQIKTPRSVVFSLDGQTSIEGARRDKRIQQHSRIPVYDEAPDDMVGIVHRRDILAFEAGDPAQVPVLRMVRPAHFVSDSTPLDALLKMFLDRRRHMFIVLNEFGEYAGVVTLEDVLEEILGQEIMDETDEVEDLRELARKRRSKALDSTEPKAGAKRRTGPDSAD